VGRCVFDIGMPIFASSAFHRQQTAAMDALKVAVGKFVSGFAVRGMSFVNTKMPFRVLSKAVEANKFVFLVGRRLIRFPESFVVRNEASLTDQLASVLQRDDVQSDRVVAAARIGPAGRYRK